MTARVRRPRLIVTFASQTDAMRMEIACPEGLGRLIPTPQALSAGCGLAWMARPGQEDALIERMRSNGIAYEAVSVIEMY